MKISMNSTGDITSKIAYNESIVRSVRSVLNQSLKKDGELNLALKATVELHNFKGATIFKRKYGRSGSMFVVYQTKYGDARICPEGLEMVFGVGKIPEQIYVKAELAK